MHGTMRSKYYQLTSAVVKGANGDVIALFLYIPGFSASLVKHVSRYTLYILAEDEVWSRGSCLCVFTLFLA